MGDNSCDALFVPLSRDEGDPWERIDVKDVTFRN